MKKALLFGIPLAAIFAITFFVFGRSVWHPFYVKIAGRKTEAEVIEILRQKGVSDFDPKRWENILILGFKDERFLEVWGESRSGEFTQIANFPFTGFSGSLGPKLKEGDRQIPEGVYGIEYLNPNSSFHLSIKVTYPNESDRTRGEKDGRIDLGDDIFIHGKSATIGCIPIGDKAIEKLFFIVSEIGIENVSVIISPYDMRRETRDLQIADIEWEDALYHEIRTALNQRVPNK